MGSGDGPGAMRRTTCAAGATAPSSRVVRFWVPRMPSVSQSSLVVTASVRSTKAKTSFGASGLVVSRPCRPRRVHTGAREVKIFVPVKA